MIADMMPGWLPNWLSMQAVQWIEFALGNTGCLMGRLAVFCSRLAIRPDLESQYVYLDCTGGLGRLGIQRSGLIVSADFPTRHADGRVAWWLSTLKRQP